MRSITGKQEEILRYIMVTIVASGSAPTIRGIANEFGINSIRGVTCHLEALEHKGFIKRAAGSHAGIQVIKDPDGHAVRLSFVSDPERISFIPPIRMSWEEANS